MNSFQAKRVPLRTECGLLIQSSGGRIISSYLLCTGRGFWLQVQYRVSFMQGMGEKSDSFQGLSFLKLKSKKLSSSLHFGRAERGEKGDS